MTRLFLVAGVAALAIAAPAAAKPEGGHGNGGGNQHAAQRGGGGGGGGSHAQAQRGGGGGGRPQFAVERGGGGGHGGGPRSQAQAFERGGHGGGYAAPRQQRHSSAMQQHGRSEQMRAERDQGRGNQVRQAQNRNVERQRGREQHMQAQNRGVERQQMRGQRMQAQNRTFERQQVHGNRPQERQQAFARQEHQANRNGRALQQAFASERINNGRFNGKQAREFRASDRRLARNEQLAFQRNLSATRFAAVNFQRRDEILAPAVVERFVGVPVAAVSTFAALSPIPAAFSYLYPPTPYYYYQYGNGYVYEVDRASSLIAAMIPLFAGGYYPGQYLPLSYMASYVPAYYGFNSFYPDYGNLCNRYANGVIYEVDCYTGLVVDVIPLYAAGYGVGQILPTSYAYYNVPYQYRRLYYDTPDYNYWYAPGAIYQYEPHTSMITSVAALLSPGFTVGQPLPLGYGVYNVPYGYRATYYDTPAAWYRYNNGYIYQVDPATQLVTAIVASTLT
jgi:hypothetical protein